MQDWLKDAMSEESKLKAVDQYDITKQLLLKIEEMHLSYSYTKKERLTLVLRVFDSSKKWCFDILIDNTRKFGFNISFFGEGQEWDFDELQCDIETLTKKLNEMTKYYCS